MDPDTDKSMAATGMLCAFRELYMYMENSIRTNLHTFELFTTNFLVNFPIRPLTVRRTILNTLTTTANK